MNKTKAKSEAMNNKRSWAELLKIVDSADLSGMSKVNKSITRKQVAEIFKSMIKEKCLNDVPDGARYDIYKDKLMMSAYGLGIMNLLREFA